MPPALLPCVVWGCGRVAKWASGRALSPPAGSLPSELGAGVLTSPVGTALRGCAAVSRLRRPPGDCMLSRCGRSPEPPVAARAVSFRTGFSMLQRGTCVHQGQENPVGGVGRRGRDSVSRKAKRGDLYGGCPAPRPPHVVWYPGAQHPFFDTLERPAPSSGGWCRPARSGVGTGAAPGAREGRPHCRTWYPAHCSEKRSRLVIGATCPVRSMAPGYGECHIGEAGSPRRLKAIPFGRSQREERTWPQDGCLGLPLATPDSQLRSAARVLHSAAGDPEGANLAECMGRSEDRDGGAGKADPRKRAKGESGKNYPHFDRGAELARNMGVDLTKAE